jgi:PAS domain S-box-containing protein
MFRRWEKLNQGQIDPNISINNYIFQSWERSRQYKVDPFKPTNTDILSTEEFAQVLEENKQLLDLAVPSMQDICDFTKNYNFCMALSDKNGIILTIIGDEAERAFTNYSDFTEGANWSEKVMGTNAVGLVLEVDEPVQVYGYEHFCKCAALSTCSAAPIHNPEGVIIGVLDLTGAYKYVHNHTLGMVFSAARAIERKIELHKAYTELEIASALKETVMESISEGIIALDSNNQIIHVNNRVCNLLGIDSDNCIGQNLATILPDNNYLQNIVSASRRIFGETVLIKTQTEKKKFLMNCSPLCFGDSNKLPGAAIVLHELHNIVKKIMRPRASITFDSLIGKSSAFQLVIEQAKMAAETNSSVLLLGESGVGKELFAQAIHNASDRKGETFITINCGAIPKDLISSELFGYEEGAFTGARKGGHPGKFELADQGTIFLDEIGEMPIDLQASLLRVLEDKTIVRVGGKDVIPTNIRLISATNKDLLQEVKDRHFRNDLYYRLNVLSINIPPLRERKGDIPILLDYFIKSISSRVGKLINKVDPAVLDLLLNYNWPGNVRELSNIVERAVNLSRNETLSVDLLPQELKGLASSTNISVWDKTPTKENVEEQLIRNYLLKFGDNKSDVAKALNISRSSLYRKMTKYRIMV